MQSRLVATVDQTMPALFPGDEVASGAAFQPIAQLGAGPDGTVVLEAVAEADAREAGSLVALPGGAWAMHVPAHR